MIETKTAPYDVAEFLETPEEMASYLEACINESEGDAAFIAKALGDIAHAKVCQRSHARLDCRAKVWLGTPEKARSTAAQLVSAVEI